MARTRTVVLPSISEMRKRAELTPNGLAELMGSSRRTICALEDGTAVPSVKTLAALADALGCNFSLLVTCAPDDVRTGALAKRWDS